MNDYLSLPLSEDKLRRISDQSIPRKNYIIIEGLKMRINKSYDKFMEEKDNKIDEFSGYSISSSDLIHAGLGAYGIVFSPFVFYGVAFGLAIAMQFSNNSSEFCKEANDIAEMLVNGSGKAIVDYLKNIGPLIAIPSVISAAGISLAFKDYIVSCINKMAEKNKRPIKDEDIKSIISGLVSIDDIHKTINDLRAPIYENVKEDDGIIFVKEFLRSVDLSKISKYINPIMFKLVEIRKASLEVDKCKKRRPRTLKNAQEYLEKKKVELANIMFKVNYENRMKDYMLNQDYVGDLIKKADMTFIDKYKNEVALSCFDGKVYPGNFFVGYEPHPMTVIRTPVSSEYSRSEWTMAGYNEDEFDNNERDPYKWARVGNKTR